MTMTDTTILYSTPAHTLEVGDQIIIEGEYCIIRRLDDDRDDIDEIHVWVENLDDATNDEFDLYADDEFEVWAL